MRPFLLGLILGLILIPVLAFLYFQSGYAPVATAAAPFPFEKRLAKLALNARIRREAPKESPIPVTPENLIAGAKLFRDNCAVCHGTRGAGPTPTARGMYPPPPQLFKGKGVSDDPVGETWWKVQNGIRLTGMPGYGASLSSTEVWQVSEMLANADKLPPEAEGLVTGERPAK